MNDYSPYLKNDARSKANPGANPVKFDASQARRYNDSVKESEAIATFLAQAIPPGRTCKKLKVVEGANFSEQVCYLDGDADLFRGWQAIDKTDSRLLGQFASPKELAIHLGMHF